MSQFTPARKSTKGELPVDLIDVVETLNPGSGYATLPSHDGARVVRMKSSVALSVRRTGGEAIWTIASNVETMFYVSGNSNELQVKRSDSGNTQVDVELLIGTY